MKLLLAIKATALAGGGTERVVSQVSAALAERGHDVSLASFDRPGEPPFYPIHPAVRQRRLGIGATGRGTGPSEALKRIAALRRLALELRPDVAVTDWGGPTLMGRWAVHAIGGVLFALVGLWLLPALHGLARRSHPDLDLGTHGDPFHAAGEKREHHRIAFVEHEGVPDEDRQQPR